MYVRPWSRAAVLVALCVAVGSIGVTGAAPPDRETSSAQASSDWTVMIYMAADIDRALPWQQDINELEAAYQAEGTNIVVLLDLQDTGDSRLLKIEHDENYFDPTIVSTELDDGGVVIPGGGEVNTGSPATLRNFVVYASTLFPADNLVLVMWGHGAGWRGLCPDGYDLLTLPELRSALYMCGETLGECVDILVLDVCSGATLELAYEVKDYADILVASQIVVPSEGLPYMETMNALAADPTQTTDDFAIAIADGYIEWATYGSAYSTSMTVFDLDTVGAVAANLGELARLGIGYDRLFHEESLGALQASEYSDEAWYIDVASAGAAVCDADLPPEMKHSALEMARSLGSAVMFHETVAAGGLTDGVDLNMTFGLTVHLPSNDSALAYSELLMASGLWDEFSVLMHSERSDEPSAEGPILSVADSSDSDLLFDYATLTWSTDSGINYTSYTAYVFQVRPQGLVLCSQISSATNIIRIDRVVGDLLISASAFVDGEAYSHRLLSASLGKLIGIDVSIDLGRYSPGRHLEVVTYLAHQEPTTTLCLNMSCVVYLTTPYQVDVGETVRVELVDADTGAVLAERQVMMTGGNVAITLSVHEPAEDSTGKMVTISIIASLALLATALVVYLNFIRRR